MNKKTSALFTPKSPRKTVLTMILTAKELSVLINCSLRKAQRLHTKIKKEKKIEHVTIFHIGEYLGVSLDQLMTFYLAMISNNNNNYGNSRVLVIKTKNHGNSSKGSGS